MHLPVTLLPANAAAHSWRAGFLTRKRQIVVPLALQRRGNVSRTQQHRAYHAPSWTGAPTKRSACQVRDLALCGAMLTMPKHTSWPAFSKSSLMCNALGQRNNHQDGPGGQHKTLFVCGHLAQCRAFSPSQVKWPLRRRPLPDACCNAPHFPVPLPPANAAAHSWRAGFLARTQLANFGASGVAEARERSADATAQSSIARPRCVTSAPC